MSKFYILIIATSFCLLDLDQSQAQMCDPSVPVFTVNLSGAPSGAWVSSGTSRNGLCCGGSGADRCVEFVITLDSNANGIRFDIVSGAVPPGALYYQVNCSPPVAVGAPICLSGPGPHHLTFCKPGGNTNTYQITSIPKPSVGGTRWVTQACSGLLTVQGLIDTSIHWTSLPSNATYNSYLSCMNGCDSVTVIPSGAFPSSVLYQVCGYVIGGCVPFYFCDTIRVNFVTDLAVNITPKNQTICFGSGLATVTANTVGGKSPFTYSWSTGATTQSINVGAGTYTVQMKDSLNCSVAYDTVFVFAFSAAINANAGPDQLLCLGARTSVSLNGVITAASGGIWKGGSGTFNPNDTTMNTNYTPSTSEITAGYAQLYLVTTGNLGCPADTDWIKVTLAPQPDPTISGNFNICQYTTSTYSASCPSTVTYSWTVTGGTLTSSNNTSSIIVQWNTPGSGSVTLYVSNAAGCDTTISNPVTINPTPTPTINGPHSACVPTTSTYSVGTVTGNNLSWSVSGGSILGSSSASSVSVQWTTPGTGTVSLTETNSSGCDSTVSISVILNPQANPQVTGSFVTCDQTTTNYTVTCSVPVTYQWTASGGTILSSSTGSTVTVQWATTGTGSLTLAATHAGGCDSVITIPITVNPKPTPAITGSATACAPSTGNYSITFPTTNNYNWSVTGGTIIGSNNGTSVNIQWSNAGTGYVTVTETNSFGCDSTVTIPVTVNPYPVPVLNGRQKVCVNDTASYWVPKVPGDTYQWKVVGGNIVSFTVDNSIEVYWFLSGSGSVSCRQIAPSGCDSSVAMGVKVDPKPLPVITGPLNVCQDEINVYQSGNNATTYNWTATGGNIIGTWSQSSTNIQWPSAGSGQLTLMQVDANGCVNSTNVMVQVNARPSPVISGSTAACLSQKLNTYSSPLVTNMGYQWNVTGGSITSGNGSHAIAVQWNSTGTFPVTLHATNLSTGCDSTVTMMIYVDSLPKPVITAANFNGCAPFTATFTGNNVGNGNTYQWTFGDGKNSTMANPTHEFLNAGTYSVSLIATSTNGCSDSTKASAVAYPSPVSYFTAHVTQDNYFSNTSPFTVNNLSTGAIQYLWNFGDGDTSTAFEPGYQYIAPGTYTVKLVVTNSYGCQDEMLTSVDIRVPEELYIPNAFTPNGDIKNEKFSIVGRNIADLDISIFNRWGERIYMSNDKDFAWDGTYKGKDVQQDVYVYVIKAFGYHGKSFDKVGTVTVVR